MDITTTENKESTEEPQLYYLFLCLPKSWEFIQFLKELELIYPEEKIKIIMDNHKIHTSKETREYLETVPDKFEFVFTPKCLSTFILSTLRLV